MELKWTWTDFHSKKSSLKTNYHITGICEYVINTPRGSWIRSCWTLMKTWKLLTGEIKGRFFYGPFPIVLRKGGGVQNVNTYKKQN